MMAHWVIAVLAWWFILPHGGGTSGGLLISKQPGQPLEIGPFKTPEKCEVARQANMPQPYKSIETFFTGRLTRRVFPLHLWLGTFADNTQDMLHKGRGSRGERTGNAKLTEETVQAIRKRYAAGGVTTYSLAQDYGVARSNISCVIRRATWTHV